MKALNELRRLISATAWAMQPEHHRTMLATIELLSAGGSVAEHTMAALKAQQDVQAARRQQISASTGGAVAVLPLYGYISQRSSWMSYYFGGTSVESFTMQLREAVANDSITAIVIDVDSPGGSVAGVDELWSEIYAARAKKTIVAISNTLMASAAYYLASAATEIVAMPSSLTGSIGVYQAHEDDSEYLAKLGVTITLIAAGKFKVEGNSYAPLDDTARAAMQAMVDGYYAMFLKAVAKGRGRKVAEVSAGFGEGRVLMSSDALAAGMVDRIGTLDSVLAKFGVQRPIDGNAFAAAPVEVPAAHAVTVIPAAKAKKAGSAKSDDSDSDSDDQDTPGDQDGDDEDDDPCECPCDPCMKDDCKGCTAAGCDAAGCQCDAAMKKTEKAKAAAEQERLLALQQQQIAVALAL